MIKKLKEFYVENSEMIAVGMAYLNGGDCFLYTDR